MKWPNTLTVVRHGQSAYNELKARKSDDPQYQEFKRAYNRRKKDPDTARKLAEQIVNNSAYILGVGDHDTAITERGMKQAEATGAKLKHLIDLPDVIFVSPYDRTHATLAGMTMGWPELAEAKTVEEERIREQEHGLALLYNDWRIFHMMHPEQEKLEKLQGPYWYRYPQGENRPDVRERMRSMMVTMTRDYYEQNVMMVTHHLSILSLRANMERLDAAQFDYLDKNEKPINCGVTIYRGDPDRGADGHLLLDVYNQQLY